MSALLSPCIGVCVIDPATKLCLGCGRGLDEIAGWRTMTDPERRASMARLSERSHGSTPRRQDVTND